MMDGQRPAVWLSDRYSAHQGHADAQQTCLAHLARDVAFADDAGEDILPMRLRLWLQDVFALAARIETLAPATIAARRRALERRLTAIVETPTSCDLARDLQNRFRRARDQLLTFARWPGLVGASNNAYERALRPSVVQRKMTNGYRAMWAAQGEADMRTVVDTARLRPGTNAFQVILQTVSAEAVGKAVGNCLPSHLRPRSNTGTLGQGGKGFGLRMSGRRRLAHGSF